MKACGEIQELDESELEYKQDSNANLEELYKQLGRDLKNKL